MWQDETDTLTVGRDRSPSSESPLIAYFSMEIALEAGMPTYSGGLGVLAGDTLRAAADLGVPMVAVTLLHRKGYFRQHLDGAGNQTESPVEWSPEQYLVPLDALAHVMIEGRQVAIRAWLYTIQSESGNSLKVYFLDTDLPQNVAYDRSLTDHLYGGDRKYRLCQEVVLGLGGIAMLSALGLDDFRVYHMNEGHSALLVQALLQKQVGGRGFGSWTDSDMEAVRERCVFTTHTPVPAGHDSFNFELVKEVLGEEQASALGSETGSTDGYLDMTDLALSFSRYVNGVAMRHGEVARQLFPGYSIDSITNGVHGLTWTSAPIRQLFDMYTPGWRSDNFHLRYATCLPLHELREAHLQAKRDLLAVIQEKRGVEMRPDVFTIGFARRTAAYKRPALLFSDLERLQHIVGTAGPLQIVYGGKAHPQDENAKNLIRQVFAAAGALENQIQVVYLEDYDITMAGYFCSGVDLWLNTPEKPYEASGTSGMKAAFNGVPSLSVLDGWWIEGHVEGVTGWAIGADASDHADVSEEAHSLYDKLEHVILPMYYQRPDDFAAVMRSAIALNGSFFNTQRMMSQYLQNAYRI